MDKWLSVSHQYGVFYCTFVMMLENYHSWIDTIEDTQYALKGVSLSMLREDKVHPIISGNKWRKLKYNLVEAKSKGFNTILSFGGAFSNHIAAVAEAASKFGFKSIGVIRGEKTAILNPTLNAAVENGMQLEFVDRESYRNKSDELFIEDLRAKLGEFYLIPEGGSNELGVKGCEEILYNQTAEFDVITIALGTGATMAGLVRSTKDHQKVLGFPALKNGDFLKEEVSSFAKVDFDNWDLNLDYHFGGYAKVNEGLIDFMNVFHKNHGIPLDPIYTGKMMYGLNDLILKGYFEEGTKILAVHTGGLQGIKGMNNRIQQKGIRISYDETA